ncbi:hypothetical protein KUTeg_004228 [Tegillarca granosa]|uniref:Deoxynucleoside kinase domain-containing protein n=1 Tax=Tegillarca granosa TaxID=220873 RepID=A0ABQ9FT30_TEGGR|nr:hypothetical protein KUTeg_004228 [Tegillarca granosa]
MRMISMRCHHMGARVIGAKFTNRLRRYTLAVFLRLDLGGNTPYSTDNGPKNFLENNFLGSMLGSSELKRITGKDVRRAEEELKVLLPKGKSKYTVSIEGNIGCGKTTLLQYFKDSPFVEAIQEPVQQWTNVQGHNALHLLYQDPKRWSFSFNLYAQLTRIQMHVKPHSKPVKLLERSLYSTRYCFVENDYRHGTVNGLEYAILKNWFHFLTERENTDLDLIVYLKADPEVCFNRIKKRSRKEEAGVPFDLIQSLHDLHEEWLIKQKDKPPAPVLVLDANNEYSNMTRLYEDKRQEILCGFV